MTTAAHTDNACTSPRGYSFATWPTNEATGAAVQEVLAEQGINRGRD